MRPRAKWLRALGNTGDAVFVVDGAQRILFWNQGAEQLLGYTEAEVRGRRCCDVLGGRLPSGERWCRERCEVQHTVRQGALLENFDLRAATKDGRDVWVSVSVIALPNRKKPLTLHLLRDAARQRRSEQAIEEIQRTLATYGARPSMAGGKGRGGAKAVPTLTRRQVEILGLVARGLSNGAIARRLGLSPYTVRNHLQNALRKLGVRSKPQAVAFAVRHGLI